MNSKKSEIPVLGYTVYAGNLSNEILIFKENKIIINTLNSYSYVVAKDDEAFQQALKGSDILLPDGFPIVLAARILSNAKIKKIAGEDVFYHLLHLSNNFEKRVFFIGASDETLELIKTNLKKDFPNLIVGFFSPPFKQKFDEAENDRMIEAINQFHPDVVFVGMTAPKQEKWVDQNKNRINSSVICSIGAVFDFYAGTVSRPSAFWIKLRLEWFIRFLKEPKRLWKRYLLFSPRFFIDVFKAKF